MNITILGSGAFGLALAKSFLINNHITIWSKFEKEVNSLKEKYKEYTFTSNIENALSTSDIIVIAIPIEYINTTLIEIKPYYKKGFILIASKGIETKTHQFAYEIIEKTFPNTPYGILSGGTFAKDIMEENIMGITLSTNFKNVEIIAKKVLNHHILKVELSKDNIGVSICGAIKNTMAIAFGILDGANYKESTKFMYLTEAILEIKRIISLLGGNENTILSYAGIDDIMMTCTSSKSRNYTFGNMIGRNKSKKEIEDYKNNTTIEGLGTTKAIYHLLKERKINSSLINIIYKILYENENKELLINYLKTIEK